MNPPEIFPNLAESTSILLKDKIHAALQFTRCRAKAQHHEIIQWHAMNKKLLHPQ
jgi:hypothetical protein